VGVWDYGGFCARFQRAEGCYLPREIPIVVDWGQLLLGISLVVC